MTTKNILMVVVLAAGMLTALTATTMSMAVPAYADKKECEDNKDNNCNKKEQKIYQKNECKNEDENKDHSSSSSSNAVSCSNNAIIQDKSGFCPLTDVLDLINSAQNGPNNNEPRATNCPPTNSGNLP